MPNHQSNYFSLLFGDEQSVNSGFLEIIDYNTFLFPIHNDK